MQIAPEFCPIDSILVSHFPRARRTLKIQESLKEMQRVLDKSQKSGKKLLYKSFLPLAVLWKVYAMFSLKRKLGG